MNTIPLTSDRDARADAAKTLLSGCVPRAERCLRPERFRAGILNVDQKALEIRASIVMRQVDASSTLVRERIQALE